MHAAHTTIPYPQPNAIQLIIARDIAKAPELTNLLKQCTKTVLSAGALSWGFGWVGVGGVKPVNTRRGPADLGTAGLRTSAHPAFFITPSIQVGTCAAWRTMASGR